ncbi:MAG: 2,5-diamino-6-ribosylamino-4(3H)-pyrimidinone 5'-phosphate reductase [Methanosaeta sp. PtaB.Bin039]|nr:MAG: 2,5-diamino-6-ribosylamino-4(3H)-pyrimidinone 5'-phosphate reductase [Methanosaeta sp. PtaB.Bin039]
MASQGTGMLPRVVLHNAVSVDGRIDGFSPDLALFYHLAASFEEDVTLAGSQTILRALDQAPEIEGPSTTADTDLPGSRPLLAVPDSRGRVRRWGALRRWPYWRGMVALVSQSADQAYLDYLLSEGVEWVVAGEDRVDLTAALQELNRRYGARVVRVDSGGSLNGALLERGLVDEVSLLVHPGLVGGSSPKTIFQGREGSGHEIPLRLCHIEQLNGSLWLRYIVVK